VGEEFDLGEEEYHLEEAEFHPLVEVEHSYQEWVEVL
jgi:hypothetical protein